MASSPSDRREFRCVHCNGRILIPHDLPPTTAPCPHCGAMITSPAVEETPTAVEPAPAPVPVAAPQPTVAPLAQEAPAVGGPPPIAAAAPAQAARVVLPERRQRPAAAEELLEEPQPEGLPAVSARASRRGLIGVLLVAALLVGGAVAAAFWLARQHGELATLKPVAVDPGREREIEEARYIRVGWREDASKVLRSFIAARTVAEKARRVIDGKRLQPQMEEFYGGGMIDDRDTPADVFSYFDLSEQDRQRGIFLMVYDLPPQFELRSFFRPLAPLDVQYNLEEPGLLLSSFARVANFSSEPVRVHAFFKRTPDGLKLDWETFVQTKYRMFRTFVEEPDPGRSHVFRVILLEDVPEGGRGSGGTRTYRLLDPVNLTDSARVDVPVDSEVGRVLAAVNWRGAGDTKVQTKTATVELTWQDGNRPQLRISRFICWEFLGLGGSEGNALTAGGK